MSAGRETSKLELRNHSFYFSKRFFQLFGMTSFILVISYFFFFDTIFIPISVDLTLVVVAIFEIFISTKPNSLMLERLDFLPLKVGKSSTIKIGVQNIGARVVVRVFDDIPKQCIFANAILEATVHPGYSVPFSYKLTSMERGVGQFGDVHFWIKSRLGLGWRKGITPARCSIKMYPALSLIQDQKIKLHHTTGDYLMRPIFKKGEGTEFDSLREYTVGDDPRLINWAATARKGKLIVRRNRMERSQNVFLVLDAGRMMTARIDGKSKFDFALESALLLGFGALELGDYVGLMLVGQEILHYVPVGKGASHFGKLLDSVYDIQPKLQEPRYFLALSDISTRLKRRSLVVIFTDLIDEHASEGLKRYVIGLLPKHLPLVVAMSDTDVISLADNYPETAIDFYAKAVASDLLDRRTQLIARLNALGVHILDVPAAEISAAVFNNYLDIKKKGIL